MFAGPLSQIHHHWGTFTSESTLPLVAENEGFERFPQRTGVCLEMGGFFPHANVRIGNVIINHPLNPLDFTGYRNTLCQMKKKIEGLEMWTKMVLKWWFVQHIHSWCCPGQETSSTSQKAFSGTGEPSWFQRFFLSHISQSHRDRMFVFESRLVLR